ncbi:MAG: tetratricopeptide repeat protein [Chthoniobacterales bacterium]
MATVSQFTSDPALETNLFWDQHKTTIIAVVAVLVLGGLAFGGYQFYRAHAASEATALLAAAHSPEDYQKVIARYPGSEPAASAYLLLAAQQRAKKNFAEANATLHKFIDQYPKHQLITTAWMGVAANLESLGKSDEALSTYQRLATEYPQSFNAPLALLAQVPLLKAKNRIEEARRACETIMSQHRDSIVANEAIQQLMALPKPAAAAMPKPAMSVAPIPMARPPEESAPAATPKK